MSNKPTMSLADLEARFKKHDFYYERSDDGKVFRKGVAEKAEILVELRRWPMYIASRLIRRMVPADLQNDWFFELGRTKSKTP